MRHSARPRWLMVFRTTPAVQAIAQAATTARESSGTTASSHTNRRRPTAPAVMPAIVRTVRSAHCPSIMRLPEPVTAKAVTRCRAPRKLTGAAAASVIVLRQPVAAIVTSAFARSGWWERRPSIMPVAAQVIASVVTGRRALHRLTGPAEVSPTARRLRHAAAVIFLIGRPDWSARHPSITRLPERVTARAVTR